MNQTEAIDIIVSSGQEPGVVIASLGLISREIFERHDSRNKLYVPGSMGLVSVIGLGIALNQPQRPVYVVEGDGSLLMSLSTLVTIGHFMPRNFRHIVLDNHTYASCSGEMTLACTARLVDLAQAAGYRQVKKVYDVGSLNSVLQSREEGPLFILVCIEPGGRRDYARPLDLDGLGKRFMDFLAGGVKLP